ncbi:MAG: DedA family protein [Nitrospirae bacterium]|nr:DedA family protein [Nitrospirota bacterium]
MDKIAFLHSLVETYGYYALLAGTFFEGETILLIGGLVARLGYLDLSVVMLVAFIGSFSGDQLYFFVGRMKGRELLTRYKTWEKRVEKVHCLMARYHDLIMVGFRFVYGIRILTPLVLGMNRSVKTGRFVLFNAIGAVIWSVAVSAGGYFFGYAIEKLIHNVKHLEIAVLVGIAGVGIAVLAFRKFRRKKC